MITYAYLKTNLERLDKLYNNTTNQLDAIFYAKLAVLELCGWVEESMDNIVKVAAKKKLKTEEFKKLHDSMVNKNYGFKYDSHFKPMLINTIGIFQTEKIESYLEKTGKISILKSELSILNKLRNDAAHTFIKGTTKTFDAPSVILSRFNKVYPILVEIDHGLKRL